jgi:hypothetical protein
MPISQINTNSIANGAVVAADLAAGAALSNLGTSQLADANMAPGSVIQVVQAIYSTTVTTTSGSFSDTGLTASITPRATSSKILVLINQRIFCPPGTTSSAIQVMRNGTQIYYINRYGLTDDAASGDGSHFTAKYLDSPATTSAITYKTQFNRNGGASVVYAQLDSDASTIVLMEIAG